MDTPEKLRKDNERALSAFFQAASTYPQQRLGQLLSNAIHSTSWETDPFYMPDSVAAERLEGYAAGFSGSREPDDGTEIERLRKTLYAIKVLTDTALHPAKAAPNGFAVISKVNEMVVTALKVPSSG